MRKGSQMKKFLMFLISVGLTIQSLYALDTAGDIMQEVRAKLYRGSNIIQDSQIFSDAQLYEWITQAQDDLAMELPSQLLLDLSVKKIYDVKDGIAAYNLPSGTTDYFLRYVASRIDSVITTSTTTIRLYWATEIPIEEIRAKELSPAYEPTEKNPQVYLWNNQMNFFYDKNYTAPVCTFTTNSGIELYYIRRPEPVTTATDVPEFKKYLYKLLITGALIRAYEAQKDYNTATGLRAIWNNEIAKYNLMYREVEKK